jgi:hypothetical protein
MFLVEPPLEPPKILLVWVDWVWVVVDDGVMVLIITKSPAFSPLVTSDTESFTNPISTACWLGAGFKIIPVALLAAFAKSWLAAVASWGTST